MIWLNTCHCSDVKTSRSQLPNCRSVAFKLFVCKTRGFWNQLAHYIFFQASNIISDGIIGKFPSASKGMRILADLRFSGPEKNHSELWSSGTLLLVTHDRALLDELHCSQVFEISAAWKNWRYWLSGNVRGKKLEFKQRGNFEFMICLSTHYIIKTQEIQEIWSMRGWATQIIIQCDLICSRVVSEILVTQITWNDCQFVRRGECYAMMFQGSRNLDLQPIAHLAHWVVAMLCNVWIHFGTSQFRSTPWVSPNDSHSMATRSGNEAGRRGLQSCRRRWRNFRPLSHMMRIISPGWVGWISNMLLTSICHQFYYCSRHD